MYIVLDVIHVSTLIRLKYMDSRIVELTEKKGKKIIGLTKRKANTIEIVHISENSAVSVHIIITFIKICLRNACTSINSRIVKLIENKSGKEKI